MIPSSHQLYATEQAALKRWRGVLEQWIADTDDLKRFPEPPEVAPNEGWTKPNPADKPGKKKNLKAK